MPQSSGSPDTTRTPAALRAAMYGDGDLGSYSLFSGDFINYGYWPNTRPDPGRAITVEERTRSQQDLYREVMRRLGPEPGHRLLEVGCGIGVGAALVLDEYAPAAVTGVDLSADQLDRAARVNAGALAAHPERLSYVRGAADDLPFPDASFDRVYSVEAAQHFDDTAGFAREARRVLRPGGRLAVTTFFAQHERGAERVGALIETVRSGVDVVRPVAGFAADLGAAGFAEVRVEPIGEHVWRCFDAWVAQTEYRDGWGRNWLRAYDNGLVDYYVVTAGT
ncbi:class I SAM-dependent methyltransferase [Nocardiopsis trehalosi]|uniref:class I SAM-dependent methyltransferase n=1 Tax=Nocardiopsis trehalosi TaxID=109329 RepID=UPI000830CC24|nr:class I SAM-dependent methyltransferase [Nocardiopsis trehalosi]